MGAKPPPIRGGGGKPPSLDNFCSYITYIAYVPHPKNLYSLCSPPKTLHSQRVPLGCLVFSVTLILPTQNPRLPPVVTLACWVVIKVFPIILLILEHKIKWFLSIFGVLSEKTDADLYPRLPNGRVQSRVLFASGELLVIEE